MALFQLKQEIFSILKGPGPDGSAITKQILKEVKNPACAAPSLEALTAMGKSAAKKLPKGKDPITPIASVLWDAKKTG